MKTMINFTDKKDKQNRSTFKKAIITAVCAALCTAALASCSETSKTSSNDTSTTQKASVSAVQNNKNFDSDITVTTTGCNPSEDKKVWTIQDEDTKQQIFDWYKNFRENPYEVVDIPKEEQDTYIGGIEIYITFKDENGESVLIASPEFGQADVYVNRVYYKGDDSVLSIALNSRPEEDFATAQNDL